MHPYSPHAASAAARHNTTVAPAPIRGRSYAPAGRTRVIGDPLDALASDIKAKVSSVGTAARAHVAAEELKIRRPRRPAARRAAFRTPPAS